MSYWPSKFHTYFQPWLTGLCGIISSCCYRDQRQGGKKYHVYSGVLSAKIKILIIVRETHSRQSTDQCVHVHITPSKTQVNSHKHTNASHRHILMSKEKENIFHHSATMTREKATLWIFSHHSWETKTNYKEVWGEKKQLQITEVTFLRYSVCKGAFPRRWNHKSSMTIWLHSHATCKLLILIHRKQSFFDSFALCVLVLFFLLVYEHANWMHPLHMLQCHSDFKKISSWITFNKKTMLQSVDNKRHGERDAPVSFSVCSSNGSEWRKLHFVSLKRLFHLFFFFRADYVFIYTT